jgi:hypothetical protein
MRNDILLFVSAVLAPAPFEPVWERNAPPASNPYHTANFKVTAPTPQIARRIGLAAERIRKTQARLWLGKELPAWPTRCPIRVTVTVTSQSPWVVPGGCERFAQQFAQKPSSHPRVIEKLPVTDGGTGGATSFRFDGGKVISQDIQIEGSLDRLLGSVLAHEVTHTLLAHHFLRPVPRWADEGSAILAEDYQEQKRHQELIRLMRSTGRAIPLRRLFNLTTYPPDVMVLYSEGYSVTRFLIQARNRKTYLAFVEEGMKGDWDRAVRSHYGYRTVEKLEEAWLKGVLPFDKSSPPAPRCLSRPGPFQRLALAR